MYYTKHQTLNQQQTSLHILLKMFFFIFTYIILLQKLRYKTTSKLAKGYDNIREAKKILEKKRFT